MMAVCLSLLILMAWRVDINEFSLNAFYRNRLVRCYLGATRFSPTTHKRNPQNFTGFDDADDMALTELARNPNGPLHLVNCALNLGGSSDLALHTRHSAALTLSPLHCGTAYASRNQQGETAELGYVPPSSTAEKGTPTLGQAISVSGAAASPNMGYHTSPVTAFLLTLFNVRLGWWFPHPRKKAGGRAWPRFNLAYLVAELFGGATNTSSLPDGVRRRTFREPRRLRTTPTALPSHCDQRRRMRPDPNVRGSGHAGADVRGRFRLPHRYQGRSDSPRCCGSRRSVSCGRHNPLRRD